MHLTPPHLSTPQKPPVTQLQQFFPSSAFQRSPKNAPLFPNAPTFSLTSDVPSQNVPFPAAPLRGQCSGGLGVGRVTLRAGFGNFPKFRLGRGVRAARKVRVGADEGAVGCCEFEGEAMGVEEEEEEEVAELNEGKWLVLG